MGLDLVVLKIDTSFLMFFYFYPWSNYNKNRRWVLNFSLAISILFYSIQIPFVCQWTWDYLFCQDKTDIND